MAKYISNVTTDAGFGRFSHFQLTKGEPVEGLTDDEYATLGENITRVEDDEVTPVAPEPEVIPEPAPTEPEVAPEPAPEPELGP